MKKKRLLFPKTGLRNLEIKWLKLEIKANDLKTSVLSFILTYLFLIPSLLFSQVYTAWIRMYNETVNEGTEEYFTSIPPVLAVDLFGNVYVAGHSLDTLTDDVDYVTLKYDGDGNLLWERRYNGPGSGWDWVSALTIDLFGNIYVTGESDGLNTDCDYATLKYDGEGDLLWERRYNGSGNGYDGATALTVDVNGNVYVTGGSVGFGTDCDYVTLKYDRDGNLLWERRYNGPGNGEDKAVAIAVDVYGNVYVTGYSLGSGTGYDYATLKYNRDGDLLWERRYNGSGNDYDEAIVLAIDIYGNVYVTGRSVGFGTNFDYITLKYDANGNQLWIARYNGPGNGNDGAMAIAVDAYGNVYVTGYSLGIDTDYDYVTLKYSPNGNFLWERRENSSGNDKDKAFALAVDDNGNVYVTGSSGDYGYLTLKYDRNGNLLWETWYDSENSYQNIATALAIDNFGNVYVTGRSYGPYYDSDYNYTTIKYIQKPGINEDKMGKVLIKEPKNLYNPTGKLVKDKSLKKGVYFQRTEKGIEKILILK